MPEPRGPVVGRRGATLGIVGGTGPEGRGLALRLAQAGHAVLIGSRDADRAAEAAGKVLKKDARLDVRGVLNEQACAEAEIVLVTMPYEGLQAALPDLVEAIGEKLVVNCVVPMTVDGAGPAPVPVEAGSAAEECQQLLPGARVVGAFQNVSARRLLAGEGEVIVDVPVCGDDEGSRGVACDLVREIPGMAAVDVGALRMARCIEPLTPLLVGVNMRYKVHAGLRIEGLELR